MLVRGEGMQSPQKALGRKNSLDSSTADESSVCYCGEIYGGTTIVTDKNLGRVRHCGIHLSSKHSQSHILKANNNGQKNNVGYVTGSLWIYFFIYIT